MIRSCYTVHKVMPSESAKHRAALDELEAMLARIPANGFAEVWVLHDRFPAIRALLHDDRGWLACLRCEGDAGVGSKNPAYTGPPDATVEFMLSTGEVDSYPAAATFPRADVLEAVRVFADTRSFPPTIAWSGTLGAIQSPDQTRS